MQINKLYLKISESLGGCQLVEQALKLYITEALELVKQTVHSHITFKMSGADYRDASMTSLIKCFAKLSGNTKLIKDLNKFKSERDFLAHNSILSCLDGGQDIDDSKTALIMSRIQSIPSEAARLASIIHGETTRISCVTDFDPV